MTSSESHHKPAIYDSVLNARLETIGHLGGALAERIAVIDGQFNVVYANDSSPF